jgi:DNA-binding NarL/FixJ family response regulator
MSPDSLTPTRAWVADLRHGLTRADPRVSRHELCDDRRVGRSVLIVDDHEPFRRAARELLTAEGYEVVGEAGDGASAVSEARRLCPAIVLLDVQLPDVDGFEVARRLAAAGHTGATILVSGRAAGHRRRMSESPALGFIVKGELTAAALAGLLG